MADKAPVTETPNLNPEPILDDPNTLALLQGDKPEPEDDIKTPQAWEEPIQKLAEGQQAITDRIAQIAEIIAAQASQPRTVERVIEREPEPKPTAGKNWRDKVKPEGAEVIQEALKEMLGEFREKELGPAMQYLISNQEKLLEQRMTVEYPDDTFGYEALKPTVDQYRKATGYQIDLETAYKQVAFANVMETLKGMQGAELAAARAGKRNVPVDDATHGTPPGSVDPEDIMDDAEKRSAYIFFGRDDKTGKSRSPKEIESLWMEHKKGAKKDMMVD